jgi:hypothetical protein
LVCIHDLQVRDLQKQAWMCTCAHVRVHTYTHTHTHTHTHTCLLALSTARAWKLQFPMQSTHPEPAEIFVSKSAIPTKKFQSFLERWLILGLRQGEFRMNLGQSCVRE